MSEDNTSDSTDPIRTAHEWLEEAAALLGVPAENATAPIRELLDLTKDVAHTQSRPAAPLTAYLVGLASSNAEQAREHVATLKAALNPGEQGRG